MNKTLLLLNPKNEEQTHFDPSKIKTWSSNTFLENLENFQFDCTATNEKENLKETLDGQVKVLFSREKNDLKAPETIEKNQESEILKAEQKLYNFIMMQPPQKSFIHEEHLFEVESLTFHGENIPKPSSGTNLYYVPTKKILSLKKPKSGLFVNEIPIKTSSVDHLPEEYDPRELQSKIGEFKYRVYETNKKKVATKIIIEKPTTMKYVCPPLRPFIPTMKSIVQGKALQTNDADCLKNSLAISVLAIIYSKIHNPKTWTPDVIDNVIRMGKLLDKSVCQNHAIKQLTIYQLPPEIGVGLFKIEYEITPSVFVDCLEIKHIFACSPLNRGIEQIFENKFNSALIEFTAEADEATVYTFGVWRKNGFFYFFDSFKRDANGWIPNNSTGSPCIHICNKLTSISKLLFKNITTLWPAKKSTFRIHGLRIIDVDKLSVNELNATLKKKPSSHQKKNKKMPPKFVHIRFDSVADVKSESEITKKLMETTSEHGTEYICHTEMNELFDKCIEKCIVEEPPANPVYINCAKHILLKSDLPKLANIQRNLQRASINISESMDRNISLNLTLSHELQLPSNFITMPDGVALLFGTKNIHQCENYNESIAVVASIIATVMSHKYSINTWNGQIIDYILSTVDAFREKYRVTDYSMFQVSKHTFPELHFGSTVYNVVVDKLFIGNWPKVKTYLRQTKHVQHYQIVISSTAFSVGIVKRYNFFYIFDPFPCDSIGYRTENIADDVAVVTRFPSIESVVNRFCVNYQLDKNENHQQTIKISTVYVRSPTKSRFQSYPESKENLLVDRILNETKKQQAIIDGKLQDIQTKLEAEQCRIEDYNKKIEKYGKRFSLVNLVPKRDYIRKASSTNISDSDSIVPITLANDEASSKNGDPVEITETATDEKVIEGNVDNKIIDNQMEICGKVSLNDRMTLTDDTVTIKPCRYVSIYALLLAVRHPLNNWNHRFVDISIEQGKNIFSNRNDSENLEISTEIIDKILVSDSFYNIVVETVRSEPIRFKSVHTETIRSETKRPETVRPQTERPRKKFNLLDALKYCIPKNKYLLVQYPNCTFALINEHEKGIFLFDSYSSMEKAESVVDGGSTVETENEEKVDENPNDDEANKNPSPPKQTKKKIETKNAAWILFSDLMQLAEYIEERVMPVENSPSAFVFYTVFVKEIEKAPVNIRLTNRLLIDRKIETNNVTTKLSDEKSFYSNEKDLTDDNMNKLLQFKPSAMKSDLSPVWGSIHPMANVFSLSNRGKQYIAICLLACAMATKYPLDKWTRDLIDTCVIQGDRYFTKQLANIQQQEYELSPSDFNGKFEYNNRLTYTLEINYTLCGRVGQTEWTNRPSPLSLSKALQLFFSTNNNYGLIQYQKKFVAFGKNCNQQQSDNLQWKYFVFDCQRYGKPLFVDNQGCAYIIRCRTFSILLKSLQWILDVKNKNEFSIFCVNVGEEIDGGKKEESHAESIEKESNESVQEEGTKKSVEMVNEKAENNLE